MNRFIFQNDNRKNLTIETQSFWESEDLVKILDAQNLIFKSLSQCIILKKESIHLKNNRFIFYGVRMFLQNMWKTVSENLCLLLSHGQGLRGELPSKKPTLKQPLNYT